VTYSNFDILDPSASLKRKEFKTINKTNLEKVIKTENVKNTTGITYWALTTPKKILIRLRINYISQTKE
jgi:hypothetical protein